MKESFQKGAQNFARAIIQPVMFMAVSGLIISIAAIMRMEFMPGLIKEIGNFFFGIVTSGVIGSLSIIFCVGIAAALSKKKTDAAITAVSAFMIFLFANNSWLTLTDRLAEPGEQGLYGTGQNMVMGIQVNDMGVFVGIILGIMVGYLMNRLSHVKFNKYLSPYEGTKFVFMVTIFATIALAIVVTYVWPVINAGVNALVNGMTESGPFGFFGYGFLNRMLLPVGMHHLLWMPLHYTPLGGTATIAGETVSGAYNIWLAQLGNIDSVTQMHPAIGFLVNFGPTAFPIAIATAFIKTARPENKAKVKAIVFPTVLLAFLAGTTEPIEFLFLFVAPILWLAHAIMFGFSFFISDVLGLKVMIGSLPETLPTLFVPLELGRQWLIPIILIGLALMEYFIFKTLILKLNLPTIGRVAMDEYQDEDMKVVSQDKEVELSKIIRGLGGVDNISEVYNCYTRLRMDVKDADKVNIDMLKTYPSSGVVDKQKHIQMIIGLGVEETREALEAYIANIRAGKAELASADSGTSVNAASTQKAAPINMYSAARGEIIPMTDIPDEVFSSLALGHGFAVKNHDGHVYAPVDGVISSIFPTKHAIGVTAAGGQEILIHMGIDTVDLNGEPFDVQVKEGQIITRGEILAQMDLDAIQTAGKDSMIIVVAMENQSGQLNENLQSVNLDDVVFSG